MKSIQTPAPWAPAPSDTLEKYVQMTVCDFNHAVQCVNLVAAQGGAAMIEWHHTPFPEIEEGAFIPVFAVVCPKNPAAVGLVPPFVLPLAWAQNAVLPWDIIEDGVGPEGVKKVHGWVFTIFRSLHPLDFEFEMLPEKYQVLAWRHQPAFDPAPSIGQITNTLAFAKSRNERL